MPQILWKWCFGSTAYRNTNTISKEEWSKKMSTLKVPGANLYYELDGEGSLLIMIPGAPGTGQVFQSLVGPLAERYQVVTYDRRGFTRSKLDGPQDYDHPLATDADDVRRLIEQLTDKRRSPVDKPALVFGNSSGATVALEVLSRYPERVDTVFAHEPLVVNLLPDAAKWIAFFDAVYDTYRQLGFGRAMHQFATETLGSEDTKVLARNMNLHRNKQNLANATYWMEHELRQYPRAEPDLNSLTAHAGQIVLVGGRDSQDQMTYQPGKVLAQKLGLDIVSLPGGHLGFMTYPVKFANELMDILEDRVRTPQ
jgi:pimeloyl-ACP methyl ester carboxylesterase